MMKRISMVRRTVAAAVCVAAFGLPQPRADELSRNFQSPPDEMKPWCYWYWLNNDYTADGITKDLEAMARTGIRLAMIGNIEGGGPVKMFSPEWYTLTRHALKEAHRVGVEIYMFNAPGWSQSGGPWIKPDQSMRRVIWNEIPASGGAFSAKVRNPTQTIGLQEHNATGQTIQHEPQDIAVLAVPRKPAVRLTGRKPQPSENELSLARASWIWYPGENGAQEAPSATRRFRYTFEADPAAVTAAQVMLTADNEYVLLVNGKEVKRDGDWRGAETVAIGEHLRAGANSIEIAVHNDDGAAGLIAAFQWQGKDGQAHLAVSGPSWQAAKEDGDAWQPAESLGPVGMPPWSLAAGGSSENALVFRHETPFKARAMIIRGGVNGKLYAVQEGGRRLVADINTGSRNPTTDFLPNGIETFSFAEVTAREFVLEPCDLAGERVILTSEPMVAQVIEKQLGRLHPDPSPRWDSYIFPATVEPDDPAAVIRRDEILNLTDKLNAEGVLTCTLPEGEWDILYFGMVTTGKVNSPAPPEASGLEVDKMSRPLVEHHFNAMFGKLLGQLTPEERAAFTGITIDSYEKGSQNWTDGFDAAFKKRTGYDPIALLPVFTGRMVDSAAVSDQFLWDLRRAIADMIATEYVVGLRDIARRHKLKLWCENYGHWGFPGEFLVYGAHADEIGGEFWSSGMNLGSIECRAASSAAHIYGKQRVFAEAFTSTLNLNQHPYTVKARGEQLFCEGINHFVLHVYAHQPRDGVPGKNPWFGTAFHRNTPWFNHARDWVKYLQRVHLMLQQGEPVADMAVYIGDFAPQMTGPANPAPAGYDFDYIGSDALLRTVQVKDGELVVRDEKNPDRISTRYRVMAVHPTADQTVRPHVRKRMEELKAAGIPFVNQVPVPAETLRELGIAPLVSGETCSIRWKARRLDDGMIFFLSNFGKTGPFEAILRVKGKVPELFHPVTGESRALARYRADGEGTRVMLDVQDTADSFFLVFRKPAGVSVLGVKREGKDVPPGELALWYDVRGQLTAQTEKPGVYVLTMSDDTERRLEVAWELPGLPIAGPWEKCGEEDGGFTVMHETTFELPADFGKGRRVILDLGRVPVMATATVNGKAFDTLWMPPFAQDVTDAVRPGRNTLRVQLTSTSNARPELSDAIRLRTAARMTVK